MLRAITGYFFGSTQEETPEAPVECETREVNDWLVVNLPDQKDCLDFDDENDDASDDMDVDEDDILLSLSDLLTPEETGMQESDEDPLYSVGKPYSDAISTAVQTYQNSFTFQLFDNHYKRSTSYLNDRYSSKQETECEQELDKVVQVDFHVHAFESLRNIILSIDWKKGLKPMKFSKELKLPKNLDLSSIYPKQIKFYKHPDVTCHPVYSKTYVNHRHPSLPPKTDIVQRIKEIEEEQKVARRAIKKNITKGQLNRQNKNYIYETSTKKHRRSNLQRNHSGANNNRKC